MITLFIISILLLSLSVYLFIPYWKHKTAIKRFHSYYLQAENKPAMEEVYVDKLGNKWYRIENAMLYPAARLIAAENYSRWADLCMMPDYFAKRLMELEKFISNPTKIREIIIDLKQKSTLSQERVTLQYLAHCWYMLEGENPCNPTAEYLNKKLEIWKQDAECEGFFLHRALSHIRDLSELSKSGLMESLMEQEAKELLTKASSSHITSLK